MTLGILAHATVLHCQEVYWAVIDIHEAVLQMMSTLSFQGGLKQGIPWATCDDNGSII